MPLRPPDLRHLDAAFSALSASPQGETSLRLFITDLFATKCVTCGRTIAADELEWRIGESATAAPILDKVHYRCTLCRDQQGRNELQTVAPTDADRARASRDVGAEGVRRKLRDRFPVPEGGDKLVDAILGLHTDRQLVGLAAILARIEGDLRAAPVESALVTGQCLWLTYGFLKSEWPLVASNVVTLCFTGTILYLKWCEPPDCAPAR